VNVAHSAEISDQSAWRFSSWRAAARSFARNSRLRRLNSLLRKSLLRLARGKKLSSGSLRTSALFFFFFFFFSRANSNCCTQAHQGRDRVADREPLARLPHRVAELRMGGEAKTRGLVPQLGEAHEQRGQLARGFQVTASPPNPPIPPRTRTSMPVELSATIAHVDDGLAIRAIPW